MEPLLPGPPGMPDLPFSPAWPFCPAGPGSPYKDSKSQYSIANCSQVYVTMCQQPTPSPGACWAVAVMIQLPLPHYRPKLSFWEAMLASPFDGRCSWLPHTLSRKIPSLPRQDHSQRPPHAFPSLILPALATCHSLVLLCCLNLLSGRAPLQPQHLMATLTLLSWNVPALYVAFPRHVHLLRVLPGVPQCCLQFPSKLPIL